jgi:hypothetical protein
MTSKNQPHKMRQSWVWSPGASRTAGEVFRFAAPHLLAGSLTRPNKHRLLDLATAQVPYRRMCAPCLPVVDIVNMTPNEILVVRAAEHRSVQLGRFGPLNHAIR